MPGKKLTNQGLSDVFKFIAAFNKRHQDGPENNHASELLQATKFDSPAVIVVGMQSCGKSALLSRLIGGDILPSAAGRCTKNLTEITLIHDPDVEHEECEVRRDGEPETKSFNLDFDNIADHKKLKDYLNTKAKELEAEAGTNVKFIKKCIYVSITSKRFESNLILVDVPGMVEIDTSDPSADSREQIINIISEYKSKRRTIALCCHDATQNLDLCTPLRLLKAGMPKEGIAPLDPTLKDTFVVLTKVDKIVDAEDIQESIVNVFKGAEDSWVPGRRIFATNCSKHIHTNEQETKYFARMSYNAEFEARLGCGQLKKLLTDTVTEIINTTVVPRIMTLIKKRLSELDRHIEDAKKTVETKCQDHSDVLLEFQKWVKFIYQPSITEADDKASKLVMDLRGMYDGKMKALFTDMFDRLVRDAVEVGDEDLEEGAEGEPHSMFEKQASKFVAGAINPGGFVSDKNPIVEELCKWLVGRYESDDNRKTFLDGYLIHIKKCLDMCIEKSCGDLPGMNQILTEYTAAEFEKMKKQFLAYDARIYKVYSGKNRQQGLCPFGMMTATAGKPEGELAKVVNARGNIPLEELFGLFIEDCMLYMQSFTNKAKMDTHAILIHDAIMMFFARIDNSCFEALRQAMDKPDCKYTYANVALNDTAAKATDALAALSLEKEEITAFLKKIEQLLNGGE